MNSGVNSSAYSTNLSLSIQSSYYTRPAVENSCCLACIPAFEPSQSLCGILPLTGFRPECMLQYLSDAGVLAELWLPFCCGCVKEGSSV